MDKKREIEIRLESTVDGILRIQSDAVPTFVKGTKLENVYRQFLIMKDKAKKYESVKEMETYAKVSEFIVSLETMKKNLLNTIDALENDIADADGNLSDEAINDFNDFRSVTLNSIVFEDIETKDEFLEVIVTYICLTFMMLDVITTSDKVTNG